MWLHLAVVLATATGAAVAQEVAERPPPPWWKSMVLYQVLPRSFKDSNGDGSGDLKGIAEMTGYLKQLGVDALALHPVYVSPMVDAGFDITNFTNIDPLFGTMQDFDDLSAKLRELDMKLIVDFVPNHTSDEHPWFKKSVAEDPDYTDFYVWKDATVGKNRARWPPNNWISAFGESVWEWSEEREQYHLHIFHEKMPDLNYRNPAVVGNMTEVLKFWLDKGVDGVRLSAEEFLFEDERYLDANPLPGTDGDSFLTQSHRHFANQPETFALLRKWAEVVYERVQSDKRDRVMLVETHNAMVKENNHGRENLVMPFRFNLMWHVNQATRPAKLKSLIEGWLAGLPQGAVATWAVGDIDHKRLPDNYGPEMVDAFNLLTGVLPGVKVTYYGEEIGMSDTPVPWEQTVDPVGRRLGPLHYIEEGGSRDPARTPMQWDDTVGAGFSTNHTTWLPVNPNYWWLNVEAQRTADVSHLKVFQAMTEARKDPVLRDGNFNITVVGNDLLVVTRSLGDAQGYNFVLVINMGSELRNYNSPAVATVVTASINSGYTPGQFFKGGSVELRPKATVLLKTATSASSAAGQHCLSVTLAAVLIIFINLSL